MSRKATSSNDPYVDLDFKLTKTVRGGIGGKWMIAMRTQAANSSIAVKSIRHQSGNRDRKERLMGLYEILPGTL